MNRPLQLTLTLASLLAGVAHAENKPLTADEIRSRLEVSCEVFVLDATGKKLEGIGASRSTWRGSAKGPLESNWGNSGGDYGQIYLHHVWTVKPDGTISVLIEEYAKEDDDPKQRKFQELLKKSEFTLEGFAPVNWKVLNNKKKNVVVRLTPSLKDTRAVQDVANLPIAGRNVFISDNKGYLWNDGDGSSFDGTYVGISTHRGMVAMSFKPFQGAQQVGEAWDNEIVLTFPGDLKVKLRSDSAFLPDKVGGKVFGLYVPGKTTDHPHSTHIFTSSSEDKFLNKIRD